MGEKKWYVLRTAGGKEKKAKEYLEKEIVRYHLDDQVDQVIIPVEKKYNVKNGKRVESEKPLMPGYVLINAELSGELERIIREEVPGMAGFLTEKSNSAEKDKAGEKVPVAIRDEEARRILGQQDMEAQSEGTTEVDYKVGDSVKITDGPFTGFSGTVDGIVEDRSKLKVIVMIFGRKTLLELSFNQVTKE